MYILAVISVLIVAPIIATNVCESKRCQCSASLTLVNCDKLEWKNLDDVDFPPNVGTLTLVNNHLKFDTTADRTKIENLPNLYDLSINGNPLGIIPPFNGTKIQFFSLQDTSLTSAEFPTSYNNSLLQKISLSNNKIRSINENDFLVLHNSKLKRLHIDSASIFTIDQNAFALLVELQSLSLQNNQLKSCEFISNIRHLSSIKLDGNQFTSLPQQLAAPGLIKTYSFTHNSISIIDESSPLYKWSKMNSTNIKIFLANNSFDCCSSLWFIRFLQTSPQFVGDAPLLRCATPADFAGKLMTKLDPNQMNCGGDINTWWTYGRIIGIVVGAVGIITTGIVVFYVVRIRRQPSRSGYGQIDGTDDQYSIIDPLTYGGPVFQPSDEDDDGYSTTTYPGSTRSTAPTHTTVEGTYAEDVSQAGGSQIQDAALLPPSL